MSAEKGWEAHRRMQAVSDEEVSSMSALGITADQMDQYTSSSGRVWVPLADHERVVGEHKDQLNKFIAEAERTFEVYETDLAASRAEVEGLRRALEIIAVGDSRDDQTEAASALIASGYWKEESENNNV